MQATRAFTQRQTSERSPLATPPSPALSTNSLFCAAVARVRRAVTPRLLESARRGLHRTATLPGSTMATIPAPSPDKARSSFVIKLHQCVQPSSRSVGASEALTRARAGLRPPQAALRRAAPRGAPLDQQRHVRHHERRAARTPRPLAPVGLPVVSRRRLFLVGTVARLRGLGGGERVALCIARLARRTTPIVHSAGTLHTRRRHAIGRAGTRRRDFVLATDVDISPRSAPAHSLSSFIRQLSYYSFKRLSDRRRSAERRSSVPSFIVFTCVGSDCPPALASRSES